MSLLGLTDERPSRSSATNISTPAATLKIPLYSTFPVRKLAQIQGRTRFAVRGCACFSLLSFLFATIENKRYASQKNEEDFLGQVFRSLSLLFAGILSLFIVKFYECRLAQEKAFEGQSESGSTVWTVPRICGQLMLEVVLSLFVIPPNSNEVFEVMALGRRSTLSLDDVLYPFHILRLYHVARFLYLESSLCSEKGLFRLSLAKVRAGLNFYVRSLVYSRYIYFAFSVLTLMACSSGLLLNVFERTIEHSEFTEYSSAIYCAGVTMATIGYGDVVPSTHIGRGVLILVGMFGNYAQAILTIGVSSSSSLTFSELSLASELLMKRFRGKELRFSAAEYLQRWWRLRYMRRHRRKNRFQLLQGLKHAKVAFGKKLVKANARTGLLFSQSVRTLCKQLDKEFAITEDHLRVNKEIMRKAVDLLNLHVKMIRDVTELRRRIGRIGSVQKTVFLRAGNLPVFIPRLSASLSKKLQRRKGVFEHTVQLSNRSTRKALRKALMRKTERLISEGSNNSLEL